MFKSFPHQSRLPEPQIFKGGALISHWREIDVLVMYMTPTIAWDCSFSPGNRTSHLPVEQSESENKMDQETPLHHLNYEDKQDSYIISNYTLSRCNISNRGRMLGNSVTLCIQCRNIRIVTERLTSIGMFWRLTRFTSRKDNYVRKIPQFHRQPSHDVITSFLTAWNGSQNKCVRLCAEIYGGKHNRGEKRSFSSYWKYMFLTLYKESDSSYAFATIQHQSKKESEEQKL